MTTRPDNISAEKLPSPASLRRWGSFWLAVGLVLLGIAATFHVQTALFRAAAHATQGKVVHMAYADIWLNDLDRIVGRMLSSGRRSSAHEIRQRAAHYPIVEFTDHQGNTHRLRSPTSRQGDKYPNTIRREITAYGITFNGLPHDPLVNILFDPNNPQDFIIDDGAPWFIIVFMVLGVILTLFGLVCFFSVWQVRRQLRKSIETT